MARKKKSRKLTDIMPARKADKQPEHTKSRSGRKPTRYELDAQAREEKRKRKHKGKPSGSRNMVNDTQAQTAVSVKKDPRIGSRKKVPLMVEFVNRPEKGQTIPPMVAHEQKKTILAPEIELERLENNEILNDLLDQMESGKPLSKDDQQFVDDCLARIAELMDQLGLSEDEENEDDLYRTFETIDINQFK
ncbi:Der GTPase-activating protein YihI [Conservatibacter flavescens]|uniref:Der GTPase-activating protein YihI n=1 Tax=Conservatibacter flavescens TaxID=28161 RepID=A0A2M8S1S9_9PAST|nr:Der GTPase-activating protein YihI [Conservatibacter flavescens]PJG85110.1 Der GTPase-activating protein YihI [Conservatibacter flavescens]